VVSKGGVEKGCVNIVVWVRGGRSPQGTIGRGRISGPTFFPRAGCGGGPRFRCLQRFIFFSRGGQLGPPEGGFYVCRWGPGQTKPLFFGFFPKEKTKKRGRFWNVIFQQGEKTKKPLTLPFSRPHGSGGGAKALIREKTPKKKKIFGFMQGVKRIKYLGGKREKTPTGGGFLHPRGAFSKNPGGGAFVGGGPKKWPFPLTGALNRGALSGLLFRGKGGPGKIKHRGPRCRLVSSNNFFGPTEAAFGMKHTTGNFSAFCFWGGGGGGNGRGLAGIKGGCRFFFFCPRSKIVPFFTTTHKWRGGFRGAGASKKGGGGARPAQKKKKKHPPISGFGDGDDQKPPGAGIFGFKNFFRAPSGMGRFSGSGIWIGGFPCP